MTFIQFLATYAKLVFWYLFKLFTLIGIPLKWATPIVHEKTFFWILSFSALLGWIIWSLYYYRNQKIVLVSLIWLFLGFLPVTLACFFEPSAGLVIEPHWLIFSSIGFFLLLSLCLQHLQSKLPRQLWITIILFLVFGWGLTSRHYNWLWADEIRYCKFWLTQAPAFKGVKFYIADSYNRDRKSVV